MARAFAETIGREVFLMRTDFGLTVRAAARLARVAPETQQRIERGDPTVQVATMCRVGAALGLKLWGKAFPATAPTLRDTGQLRIAAFLRKQAHSSTRVAVEVALGNLSSADVVFYCATEILHLEIERLIGSFEAPYRRAADKRDLLAAQHQRPVRLVLAIEDTRRNRAAVRPHANLIASALPATSREVLRAMRMGTPLGRDGIVWVRRPAGRPPA